MLHAITEFVTTNVETYGILAVFLLMLIESACIPAPAEVTMIVAGVLVANGHASFVEMVAAGVVGNLVGSLITWEIGRRGGRPLLEKHGGKVGIKVHHIEAADTWFERYGSWAVLITRCIPLVRTFISLPAGIARMPLVPFVVGTTIGCIPFVALFAWMGYALGDRWEDIHTQLDIANVIVVLVFCAGAAWFVRRTVRRRQSQRV